MYKDIIEIVKRLVGHEYLHLETAIQIKLSPHTWPVMIWALCVSPDYILYVMDEFETWYDVNAERDALIVPSIYQRVKAIEQQYTNESMYAAV